jgi:large subunit ribosomal protein L21
MYNYRFSIGGNFPPQASRRYKTMSYAIIRTGGKQFAVEDGQVLRVPTIDKKAGEELEIEALLTGEGADAKVGAATVKATVVSHGRADKIIIFKKKRRKQYKRKQGHRQGFTEIKIGSI